MNGYEKIAKIINQQGKSPPSIMITTMDSNSTCKVNDLCLDQDDLLIAEHLKTGYYIRDGDKTKFIEPITANDTVFVIKISDEQYAIIERLVNL